MYRAMKRIFEWFGNENSCEKTEKKDKTLLILIALGALVLVIGTALLVIYLIRKDKEAYEEEDFFEEDDLDEAE